MSKIKLSENFIKNTVKLALNEDLYPSGDITSDLVRNDTNIKTKLISNQNAIIGGLLFVKHDEESNIIFFMFGQRNTKWWSPWSVIFVR